jgi:uncharacterized protein (TIGR02172 family)
MTDLIGPKITAGRTAEIFIWEENKVLKLFREWAPAQMVEREAGISHAVFDAGLPVPEPGEIIEIYNRMGLIYEKIPGISMLEALGKRPWKIRNLARQLAELHAKIHNCDIATLPPMRQCLEHKIISADVLSKQYNYMALSLLSDMPDGINLCHGDFHPGNILITLKGPIMIDWVDATSGNPIADVARTLLLSDHASLPKDMPSRRIFAFARQLIRTIYLNHYFELRPEGREQLMNWQTINAAARLEENIAEERDRLIYLVQSGLSQLA